VAVELGARVGHAKGVSCLSTPPSLTRFSSSHHVLLQFGCFPREHLLSWTVWRQCHAVFLHAFGPWADTFGRAAFVVA